MVLVKSEPSILNVNPVRFDVTVIIPVATEHVGWAVILTVGAAGVDGCPLTVIVEDANEMHPDAFFAFTE